MKKRNHKIQDGRYMASFENVTNMALRIIEDSEIWENSENQFDSETEGSRSVVQFNVAFENKNEVAWLVNQARAA